MPLNFYTGDLYPNLGYMRTGMATLPGPTDQTATVDNQTLAENYQAANVSPGTHKSIWVIIGIIVAVIVLFSAVKI